MEGFINQDLSGSLPSIGIFLGWVLYIKWYSTFNNRKGNTVLKVGSYLPELELQDIKKTRLLLLFLLAILLFFFSIVVIGVHYAWLKSKKLPHNTKNLKNEM